MTNSVPPSPNESPQNSDPQREFSARVAEQLGWYVYALRDPRDNRVFYIGKGKGNRVFAHANAVDFASVDDHDMELDRSWN
ncbi:hypothetical protein GCM10009624_28230 [Gordonia sinesedis]